MVKRDETYETVLRSLLLTMLILLSFPVVILAQTDRKYIRQGNREYDKAKYPESEINYRKATDKNKESADAIFNTGDALYKQKKYEEAGKQFDQNFSMNEDKKKKSASLHNLGNSLLMANKVQESIDAYKGSLKLNPSSKETKYNLAYAQDLLKKQQEQKKQQQQDQDKDKQQNKNKKDQKDNKDKQDKQNQQDKNNQDQQDKNNQDQQQQQQQQGISKEDAQRMLNAVANDEKNVQEKVKLAKASQGKVRTLKNW
jgi:Ca-activated chloride channel homolog